MLSYALLHPSKRRAQLAQYDSHSRVHSLHLNQLGVQLQPIGPIAGRNRRKTRRMGLATRAVQSKLWRNDKEHSTLRCEAAPAIQQWPGRSKQLHASACARKSGTLGSRDVAIPLFALCLTAGRRLQALFRTHHHSIAQPLLHKCNRSGRVSTDLRRLKLCRRPQATEQELERWFGYFDGLGRLFPMLTVQSHSDIVATNLHLTSGRSVRTCANATTSHVTPP